MEERDLGKDQQEEETNPATQTKNNSAKNKKKKEKRRKKKTAGMEQQNLGKDQQEQGTNPATQTNNNSTKNKTAAGMEEQNLGNHQQEEGTNPATQTKNNSAKNKKKKEKRRKKKTAGMEEQNLENDEQTNSSDHQSLWKKIVKTVQSFYYKTELISDRSPTEDGSLNQTQALHEPDRPAHSSSVQVSEQGSPCQDYYPNEPHFPHDEEGSSNDNRTSQISLVLPDHLRIPYDPKRHLKVAGRDAPPVIEPTDVQPDDSLETNRPHAARYGEKNPTGTQQQATDSPAETEENSTREMTASAVVEEPNLGNHQQEEGTNPATQTNNNSKTKKKKKQKKKKNTAGMEEQDLGNRQQEATDAPNQTEEVAAAAAVVEEPNLGNQQQEATDAPNQTEENIPEEMAAAAAVVEEPNLENLEQTNSSNDENRREGIVQETPSLFSYEKFTEAYICAQEATTDVNRNTSVPVFDYRPFNERTDKYANWLQQYLDQLQDLLRRNANQQGQGRGRGRGRGRT